MLRRVVAPGVDFAPGSPAFRTGGQGMPGLKVTNNTQELTAAGGTPERVPEAEIHGVFFAPP